MSTNQPDRRVAIGADSRGFATIQHVAEVLVAAGYQVQWFDGASGQSTGAPGQPQSHEKNSPSSDYPDQAWLVATAVARGDADWGVLASGSGIGMCITANKIDGVRAVLAHDEWIVRRARAHHDCNVICIAADLVGIPFVNTILETWMKTPFEGGRHERRVRKIAAIERGEDPRITNQSTE